MTTALLALAEAADCVEASAPTRSRRLWNPVERRAGQACDTVVRSVGLTVDGPSRWAIVVATGSAGEGEFCRQFAALSTNGERGVRPSTAPQAGLNSVAALLSIEFNAIGPNLTICGPAPLLGYAVHWAGRNLESGEADFALVVAVEETSPAVALGLGPCRRSAPMALAWEPRTPDVLELYACGTKWNEIDLGSGSSAQVRRPIDAALELTSSVSEQGSAS